MEVFNMQTFLAWFLANFGLAMFILAVILIFIHSLIARRYISTAEIVYRWIALFPLGFTSIYTFILHVAFSDMAASAIGWQASPFQFEVAMADLAIGVLGIVSFRASYPFRLATVIAAVIFLWGDAIGHIYQMIVNNNFNIGNAGSWFWIDIVVPLILLICICHLRKERS